MHQLPHFLQGSHGPVQIPLGAEAAGPVHAEDGEPTGLVPGIPGKVPDKFLRQVQGREAFHPRQDRDELHGPGGDRPALHLLRGIPAVPLDQIEQPVGLAFDDLIRLLLPPLLKKDGGKVHDRRFKLRELLDHIPQLLFRGSQQALLFLRILRFPRKLGLRLGLPVEEMADLRQLLLRFHRDLHSPSRVPRQHGLVPPRIPVLTKALVPQEPVRADAEQLGHGYDGGEIRGALSPFPLAHRLGGDPQLFRQLLLGYMILRTQPFQPLAEILHANASFLFMLIDFQISACRYPRRKRSPPVRRE